MNQANGAPVSALVEKLEGILSGAMRAFTYSHTSESAEVGPCRRPGESRALAHRSPVSALVDSYERISPRASSLLA